MINVQRHDDHLLLTEDLGSVWTEVKKLAVYVLVSLT